MIPSAVRDMDIENKTENIQSKFKMYLTKEEYLPSCTGKISSIYFKVFDPFSLF